jgi:hypothetical protein
MSRLRDYFLFNRNILIGFVGAFLTGAISSQAIARFTSPLVNSLISLIAELGVFLTIFGVLFYLDNKHKFIDEHGKRRESGKLKWVLVKLASTLSVSEIEYKYSKTCYSLLASYSGLSTFHRLNYCKFYCHNRIPCCCRLYGISYSVV